MFRVLVGFVAVCLLHPFDHAVGVLELYDCSRKVAVRHVDASLCPLGKKFSPVSLQVLRYDLLARFEVPQGDLPDVLGQSLPSGVGQR